jgi:hypothetical protein
MSLVENNLGGFARSEVKSYEQRILDVTRSLKVGMVLRMPEGSGTYLSFAPTYKWVLIPTH